MEASKMKHPMKLWPQGGASKDFPSFPRPLFTVHVTVPFAALRYFPHVPPLRVTNSPGRGLATARH